MFYSNVVFLWLNGFIGDERRCIWWHLSMVPDIPEEEPKTINQMPLETKQEVQSEQIRVQKPPRP